MKLYRTQAAILLEDGDQFYELPDNDWDALFRVDNLHDLLKELKSSLKSSPAPDWTEEPPLKPIVSQEVWASGVTYLRSRDARMQESEDGGDCYDRVYDADRPELFFKATAGRTVGPGQNIRIRRDSSWDVPEPELTLMINQAGKIQGYTIGNDMSSRSIEGQNPLYLPQAKTYSKCAGLGPCVLVLDGPIPTATTISLEIWRAGSQAFAGSIAISQIKRRFEDLVAYLYAECEFPNGCFLMTGTGIVPPDDFTLQPEDNVRITIEGIGTLENKIERKS
ncbi:MAG: fumarylacetoacetate hydrolase family protein [Bacteroidota bacterium]